MDFINNTNSPALSFEGIDQLKQYFHVVVTRHTYTWNEKGLLQLHETQDGLCMEDVLVDKTDFMSGVIEESDLCHYKPKCDILVLGHAYTPTYAFTRGKFLAKLHVQTPDKYLFEQTQPASKYLFAQPSNPKPRIIKKVFGNTLVDKSLLIYPPRLAELQKQSLSGRLNYHILTQEMPKKVSLNPHNSFGGYCYIEAEHKAIQKIATQHQISEADREKIKLNPYHGLLGYFNQDHYNPYGTGYISADYAQAMKPIEIKLPQIYSPQHVLEAYHLEQMSEDTLDQHVHASLVNSFGIRNKSHPDRHQYLGRIDQNFIESNEYIPEGFDFAIWNCSYPDQQVEQMVGNEWINLTNLCDQNTLASYLDNQGNIQLRLYLPETLVYLLTNSNHPDYPESEVPMKLDTIIIRPDEQKVHMVWRGIIAKEYDPKTIILKTSDRAEQQAFLQQYFTRKGDLCRPYEEN